MLRKLMCAATVAAAVVSMAMPASAEVAERHAELKVPGTNDVKGAATVGWDGKVWKGNVQVDAGALAPGKYVYVVLFEDVKTPFGVTTTGDAICTFRVGAKQHATGCRGSSHFLTEDGTWGKRNLAQVFPETGGNPNLEGLLKR
jgi:hypothetical protein